MAAGRWLMGRSDVRDAGEGGVYDLRRSDPWSCATAGWDSRIQPGCCDSTVRYDKSYDSRRTVYTIVDILLISLISLISLILLISVYSCWTRCLIDSTVGHAVLLIVVIISSDSTDCSDCIDSSVVYENQDPTPTTRRWLLLFTLHSTPRSFS